MRKRNTRIERLKGRGNLKQVFDSPNTLTIKEYGGKLLLRPNGLPISRLGVVLARGFPSAVVRNRSKRCTREFVRQLYPSLIGGFDLVFVLFPPPRGESFSYSFLAHRLLSRSSLEIKSLSPYRKGLINYE